MRISALLFLFLGLGALTFTGCDDDEGEGGVDLDNISESVAGNPDFSILLAALQEANLDDDLADESQVFTVFAPTNLAFENAGITADNVGDVDNLEQILLYHVLAGGRVASEDLVQGQTYASTATATGPENTQLSLLIERDGTSVTLNGDVSVATADLAAQNGIIHVINELLTPPDVVDLALANSNLSELVSALGSASGGLVGVLADPAETYTVFAPLNSGFEAIETTVAGLSADQLSEVLLYHVVAGDNLTENEFVLGTVATANNGATFNFSSIDPVEITSETGNTVRVVGFNVQGTNGVVHILEDVLIPNLD